MRDYLRLIAEGLFVFGTMGAALVLFALHMAKLFAWGAA